MKREVFSSQLFEAVPDRILRDTPKLTKELLVSWALATPEELNTLANSHGFTHKRTTEYDHRDPFVQENQWIQMEYFVSEYRRM